MDNDDKKGQQTVSMSSLRIISFNPNSIGRNPKRSEVLQFLQNKQPDVVFISDSRIGKEIEFVVQAEWGGKAYFASYTSQARGVALLFRKGLAIDIMEETIFRDNHGNFIALNCKYESKVITLGCVYGPNNDNPEFYKNIVFHEVERLQSSSDFTIIGGDWNITLNHSLDTHGYKTENNPKAKLTVKENMENCGLVDIFRDMHPNLKRFSWRQFGGSKRARLDYFLTSAAIVPFIEKTEIMAGIASDHSLSCLTIDFSRFRRGKGFFKFNNSLLKDNEYIDLIKNTIRSVTALYAEEVYAPDFLMNMSPEEQQNILLTINPQLFLEALLLEIRGKTISYCAWRKKCNTTAYTLAVHRLELLEIASDKQPSSETLKQQLEQARLEVQNFTQRDTEAAAVRARVNWRIDGEKPSKFFCDLERHNALQKYIPQLFVKSNSGEEIEVNDQAMIDLELYHFYQKLYRSQESMLETLTIDEFIGNTNAKEPKLSREQASKLEGLLSVEEATIYMKKCRGDASPGSSGFTGAFFKFFWRNLKVFIVNSLNYAYQTGNLSITQKLGVIILLPKPEKDKRYLSNWRPISLLNHTYKILSGALAERLKPVLPDIVNPDQKGFVRGRFMGECIRNTYDIMSYAKENNKIGLLLMIDFEKAFDSISHSYIIKTLHFFGFGYSFMKWINILLNDTYSCINHCGNITQRFPVGRSCRQGDPISPYLFILCVEVLAIKIRGDDQVKGFRIGGFSQKLDFYADDLTAYLDGSESSLRRMVDILGDFFKVSGLRINLSKCKAVWFGKQRLDKTIMCEDLKLIWTDQFRLLGVDFDSDLSRMDLNFRKKIEEIKKLFNCWLYRHLTPYGRVTIIKSLALSKLTHVALVAPHAEDTVIKELEAICFKFLWKNKPDRMRRASTRLPCGKGGLKMVDIGKFWDSLKISWSRRITSANNAWYKLLQVDLIQNNFDINDLCYGGPSLLQKMGEKLSNPFWKETLRAFSKIQRKIPYAHPHLFFHLNIFDNDFFAVHETELQRNSFPSLWVNRICQVGDFFNVTASPPKLMCRDEFNDKYGLEIDFLSFHRIRTAIICGSERINHKTYNPDLSDLLTPRQPVLFKLGSIQTKGCGIFYQTLMAEDNFWRNTTEAEAKWSRELGSVYSIQFWDSAWRIINNTLVSNKVRWIQLQINHYILPTNYTVNKYNHLQPPFCSFCPDEGHLESLPALLFDCVIVRSFWEYVTTILTKLCPNFKLTKRAALFGDVESPSNSVTNTILLISRVLIWNSKFTSKGYTELRIFAI